MNHALKFLLFAAGAGLVILLITVAVLTAKKGQDDTTSNLDQYGEVAAEYEDADLKVYDGGEVQGDAIKDLINKYTGDDYLSIKVVNGKGNTSDYIHASTIAASNVVTIGAVSATTISTNPADVRYINDAGTFLCQVFYDANGAVACLRFQQQ